MQSSSHLSSLKATLIGLAIVIGMVMVVVGGCIAASFVYHNMYAVKIYPGVSIFGIPLGGLTEEQARVRLEQATNQTLAQGFSFDLAGETLTVSNAQEKETLVSYQIAAATKQAFALGHSGHWWKDGLMAARLRFHALSLAVPLNFDDEAAKIALHQQLEGKLQSVRNAELQVNFSEGTSTIKITPEQVGTSVDVDEAIKKLQMQAKSLSFKLIGLPIQSVQPTWTSLEVERLSLDVPDWLFHAPFKLTSPEHTLTVTTSTLAGWLNVVQKQDGLALGLDPVRMQSTLENVLGDELSKPQNGKLVMEGEKVKLFQAPIGGVAVEVTSTLQTIQNGWTNNSSTMAVTLVQTEAIIDGPDAERLGVRELIGIGRSNFANSPSNRRKNIALGAERVNGSLIAPDTEFSLLKTLGPVDGRHGWLPELVIKGNKTTPEFGGGLCQIGTTTFRAALASGMPITQRQNHSYRVRYYEPAGTDATIYEPAPDFRFKNDTGHWLMISTKVKGDNLTFSTWGTRDGRTVVQTEPKIYNIVSPPPKKMIETLDLPVGKIKCTEVAHAGADAKFDYRVTYASGEEKKVTFNSHYKPWGAVCLIGVDHLTESANPSEKVDETGINNPT